MNDEMMKALNPEMNFENENHGPIPSTPEVNSTYEAPIAPAYNEVPQENVGPVAPQVPVTPAEPAMVYPEVSTFEGFGNVSTEQTSPAPTIVQPQNVNPNNLNYSAFDVPEANVEEPTVAPVLETPVVPQAPLTETKEEEKILQDALQSTPANMDDQVLKLEDTLSRNNLREQIQNASTKDETKLNQKAIIFIASIFVLLAALILLLPHITKVF